VERFETQERGALIVLARVEEDAHLRHLGVAELDDGRIVRVVEKPAEPASRYGVTGLYFFDGRVWEILPGLEPSDRDELEITDVMNRSVDHGGMGCGEVDGYWGEAGGSIDAYYEVKDFVRATRRGRAR
jgi:glucose-1-phosphate thymidylyltransferase